MWIISAECKEQLQCWIDKPVVELTLSQMSISFKKVTKYSCAFNLSSNWCRRIREPELDAASIICIDFKTLKCAFENSEQIFFVFFKYMT